MTNYTSEDWIKAGRWDIRSRNFKLAKTLETFLTALRVSNTPIATQVKAVKHFMTLIAWIPAPERVKSEVAQFLAENESA